MRSRISNVQDLAIMPGCETGLVSLEPTNPGIPNVEDDLQWPLRTPQCPARPPTIFYKANPHVAATDLETATQLLFTLEADHAGQLFIWEYLGYLEEIVCRYTLPDQAPYQQAKGLVEDLETMAKAFGIPKSEYLVWELGGLAKKDREAREKMRAREEKKAREEKRTSTEKRTSAESKTRKQRRTREERKVREERRARAEKKLEEEKKAEEERNTQIEELRTMLHEILGEVDATPDEQTEMQLEYLGRVISDLGEELEQTIDKMGKGGAGKHCRVEVRRKKGGQQGGGAEQNV